MRSSQKVEQNQRECLAKEKIKIRILFRIQLSEIGKIRHFLDFFLLKKDKVFLKGDKSNETKIVTG